MTEAPASPRTEARPSRVVETPFVGLRPFSVEDADFFFGRDDDRAIIGGNLRAMRLTLLYGPSGVGKSSILEAGVAHDLRERARRNLAERGSPELAVVVFRSWRDDPVAGLLRAVEREVTELVGEVERRPTGDTLAEVLDGWSEILGGVLLIVLDQFEEFFLYHGDEEGEGSFAFELAGAVASPILRANFLVSIREDAYAKLDRFEGEIPGLYDNYIRLDDLDADGARAAIRGPIEEYNRRSGAEPVGIEDKLVQAVLRQVRPERLGFGQAGAGEPDGGDGGRVAAPFLQLVMERLWDEERRQDSSLLRLSTLHRLGDTRGLVEAHVRAGMGTLTEDEQDDAARVFLFLVTRSGTKVAHTAADLADFADLPEKRVERVLEKLADRRTRILNAIVPPGSGGATRYELFHDVLAEAVLDWRAERVQALQTQEAEERARKARRRASLLAAFLAVAIVFAGACLVLLVLTIDAKRSAERSKRTALAAQSSARSQKLVAQSVAALGVDPDRAVRLADRAVEVEPTREAEKALRTAVGSSPLRVVIRHPGGIVRTGYDADGKRIFAFGADGSVSVSDARTGRRLATIEEKGLTGADLSSDGRRLVTAGPGHGVRFWDASTGSPLGIPFRSTRPTGVWIDPVDGRKALATGPAGSARIWTLGRRKPLDLKAPTPNDLVQAAFSPDGSRVVVRGRDDPVVWIFDVGTGRLLHALRGHTDTINDVAWSSDGRRLVTGGDDQWALVWDAHTGKQRFFVEDSSAVDVVAYSASGDRIATGAGKQVRVWDAHNGRQLAVLRGHRDWVEDVGFRKDGQLVVTASNDGTARVWDVASQDTLRTLLGHASVVGSAAFAPDDRSVLTGGADGTARVWDVATGRELRGHEGWLLAAAFSPDGKRILTGGQDRKINLWDGRSGRYLESLPYPPSSAVNSVRFSRDGRLAVTAENDGLAVVRRRSDWAPIQTIDDNAPTALTDAVFSPDGKRVATGAADGYAGIFDARTGDWQAWLSAVGRDGPAHRFGSVTGIAWSSDGRFVATTSTDSRVNVWGARSHRLLRTLFGHVGRVLSPSFAPNSDLLVTAGADRTARVWNVTTDHEVARLSGHSQALSSAAFSPDGRLVVTGDAGGVTRVWDWRHEKLLAVLPMQADFVNAVSFSPDGGRILAASDDSTAKIFRCETCVPLDRLRELVRRREQIVDAGSR